MKHPNLIKQSRILLLLSLLIVTSCTRQQNWPQFRGPESNMLFASRSLPEEWANDKNIAWTYDQDGVGWSSPIIWGDKIFITSAVPVKTKPAPADQPAQRAPQNTGQQSGQQAQRPPQGPATQGVPVAPPRDTSYLEEIYRWQVTCIDLNSGNELWKQTAYEGTPRTGKHANNNYACETPVTDGERVYAYFGMHGLFCYDLDGTLLWKKDFGSYWTQNGWGTGSSPALYNGRLFIQNDNEENSFLLALDAATGEEKWKVQRDEKTSYSTPLIWKNKLRTELVTTAKTARSYDPETGALLWEMKLGGEHAIASAVGDKDLVYLGNPGNMVRGFLYAVKPGASGDITPAEGELSTEWIAWTYTKASLGNPSSLLYNGKIYNIGSRGGLLFCLDALSGEEIFNGRVPGMGAVWASPWGYNGKVWYFDENGVTATLQPGDSLQFTTNNKLDDKFWASVAISGDKYIFKGVKKLYCVKL